MPSTMEEQSMSAPSVESPPGATTTDPTGTTNKLEKAVNQLNVHMDRMSTFLGQLCQSIPTGKCSREARETGSHDPTGGNQIFAKFLKSFTSTSKQISCKKL